MDYDMSWLTALGDKTAQNLARAVIQEVDTYAKTTYPGVPSTHSAGGARPNWLFEQYSPTFLNDAMFDQKPLQSYGQANYNRLKSIWQSVDPAGFWSTRMNGFKFE